MTASLRGTGVFGWSSQPRTDGSALPRAARGASLPLVASNDDIRTYDIGIGRQITDRLAGAFSLTHEPENGAEAPTLAPCEGQLLATVALSYDVEGRNIAGGVTYGMLGDAENGFETDYNDGSVRGAGVRVSRNF